MGAKEMSDELLSTIEDAIKPRIDALINKEGDLGRLAFTVTNAMKCISILSSRSSIPEMEIKLLSALIVEAIVESIKAENTQRFPFVYEEASKIMSDAEEALNDMDLIKNMSDEIISRMAGKFP